MPEEHEQHETLVEKIEEVMEEAKETVVEAVESVIHHDEVKEPEEAPAVEEPQAPQAEA